MITISLDDELEALFSNMAARVHTQSEQFVKDLIKHHAESLAAKELDFFATDCDVFEDFGLAMCVGAGCGDLKA